MRLQQHEPTITISEIEDVLQLRRVDEVYD